MKLITENNFNLKLQRFSCCLANKGMALLNKQNLGIDCYCEFRKFQYYTILLEVLRCYLVDDDLTTDIQDERNAFCESKLLSKLEEFDNYCGICC
jgi:hypothetical protein